jgi:lipoprotein-anchoring transpeptidase ErfK/SrfK
MMFKISAPFLVWVYPWIGAVGLVLNQQAVWAAEIVTQPTILPHVSIGAEARLEVSLSRRRVTLYRENTEIKSYPVAIGSPEYSTPTGVFHIIQMVRNPAWRNPLTGSIIPPAHPANPLGRYWIGFSTEGPIWFGFHGTNAPESIGKAVSHGCLRMYNQDVEELFSIVQLGTVIIISQ